MVEQMFGSETTTVRKHFITLPQGVSVHLTPGRLSDNPVFGLIKPSVTFKASMGLKVTARVPLSFDAVVWITKARSLCSVYFEPCSEMFLVRFAILFPQ